MLASENSRIHTEEGLSIKAKVPLTGSIQIGKVPRQVGVGYIGEVLLQLSRDLPPRGRIECLIKIPERVRRGNENQAVELIASIRLIQRLCDFMNEVPFVRPVQIFARLQCVVSRTGALVRSTRPLGAQLMRVTVDIRRNEFAVGVEGVLRLTLLQNAGPAAVRDDIPSLGMFHYTYSDCRTFGQGQEKSLKTSTQLKPA